MIASILSLLLFISSVTADGAIRNGEDAPKPDAFDRDAFDRDAFVEALAEKDVFIVNETDVAVRGGADTCTAMTTARSARFTTCLHLSSSNAQTAAWRRSDYERTVFQRGVVVVYLRQGASQRLVRIVDAITNAESG